MRILLALVSASMVMPTYQEGCGGECVDPSATPTTTLEPTAATTGTYIVSCSAEPMLDDCQGRLCYVYPPPGQGVSPEATFGFYDVQGYTFAAFYPDQQERAGDLLKAAVIFCDEEGPEVG